MATKKSFLDGRKTWFTFAALAAATTAFVIFNLLSSLSSTSTYWILDPNGDTVEARTQITPDMLVRVSVPESAMPANTIELADIQAALDTADISDDYYSIVRLQPGDIITTSNVGQLTSLGAEVPDSETKVAASFKVSPSLAAGGNIKAGDLIDIAVIYEDGPTVLATFFLSNIPVISATIDLDGRDPEDTGAPVLYVVALSAKDAAKIAVAAKYSIYVVLSAPDGSLNSSSATTDELITSTGTGSSSEELNLSPDSGIIFEDNSNDVPFNVEDTEPPGEDDNFIDFADPDEED